MRHFDQRKAIDFLPHCVQDAWFSKTMVQESIAKIDEAALALVQALNEYGPQVEPYLGPDERACIACLREDVDALRRALLGAQMGPLYWDSQPAGDDAEPPANPT